MAAMGEPYFDDGRVAIYLGDCREIDVWRRCGVVATDPPYGIGWSRSANPARQSKAHSGIVGDESTACRDEALALVRGKPAVVFGSFYAPYPEDVKQVLVWHKPLDAGVVGSVTGFRRDAEPIFLVGPWPQRSVLWSSVLRSRMNSIKAVAAETGHPHTKPVDLMRLLIEAAPGGLIADPFCGSGSTLVAAKHLGRRAVGVELDERYCEIAARRLSQEVMDFGEAS